MICILADQISVVFIVTCIVSLDLYKVIHVLYSSFFATMRDFVLSMFDVKHYQVIVGLDLTTLPESVLFDKWLLDN